MHPLRGHGSRCWRPIISDRFGIILSCSSCLNYHRLQEGRLCAGWVHLKRPKKRLVKADEGKREAFVAEYAAPLPAISQAPSG